MSSADSYEPDPFLGCLEAGTRELVARISAWLLPDGGHFRDVSGHEILTFAWYELPVKWLGDESDRSATISALVAMLWGAGHDRVTDLIDSELTGLVHDAWDTDGDKARSLLGDALDASGLEPPDTELLAWGVFMGIDEARHRADCTVMLENAVDEGRYIPGHRGWRQAQQRLTVAWLQEAGRSTARLEEIHAERRQRWLGAVSPDAYILVAPILPDLDFPPVTDDDFAAPLRRCAAAPLRRCAGCWR